MIVAIGPVRINARHIIALRDEWKKPDGKICVAVYTAYATPLQLIVTEDERDALVLAMEAS